MSAAALFAVFALLVTSLRPILADQVKTPVPAKKNPPKSTKTVTARTGSARTRQVVVTRKKVNGRWVRVTQVFHSNPAPTYQTHPDSDRYQQIQQALANGGYFKGLVDGRWGEDSVAALKQFQTDRNIPNDGKISSLSLIGLGLGPNRETVSAPAPLPVAPPPAPPAPEAH